MDITIENRLAVINKDIETYQGIMNVLNKEKRQITHKNSFQLFEKLGKLLVDHGFKNFEFQKDKEKWFSDGERVVFNCPHYCSKISFGVIEEERFKVKYDLVGFYTIVDKILSD